MAVNYTITYNELPIKVDPELFCLNSGVFRQIYNPESNAEIILHNKYPMDTFKEFILAIENKEIQITPKNCNDLDDLAKEWEVPTLIKKIEDFHEYQSGPEATAIALMSLKKADRMRDDLDARLAGFGDAIFNIQEVAQLPIETLERILSHDNFKVKDQSALFDFLLGQLQSKGAAASSLFSNINLSSMPIQKAKALLGSPNLDTKALAKQIAELSISLLSKMEKSEEEIIAKDASGNEELAKESAKAEKLSQKKSSLISEQKSLRSEISNLEFQFKNFQNQLHQVNTKLKAHEMQPNAEAAQNPSAPIQQPPAPTQTPAQPAKPPKSRRRKGAAGDPFIYIAPK